MSMSNTLKKFGLACLRLPLKLLVREQQAPADPKTELGLSTDDHVMYVLRTKSMTSIELLRRRGLALDLPDAMPTNHNLATPAHGSCMFINNRPLLFSRRRSLTTHKKSLEKLVSFQRSNPEKNVKLVPVSIFWGRNPGKKNSLLRDLMSSIEESSRIGKIFIVLFLGRQCFMQYGQPLDLTSDELNLDQPAPKLATKLSRVLRVHFNRQWIATMGPRSVNRRDLVDGIVASDEVQQTIEREAKKSGKDPQQLEKQAQKYVKEIAASYSPRMIRFMSGILSRMWNKIYAGIEVNNISVVREKAQDHEIIYMPCHRSHTDYLLLSYQLYREGLVAPHIAAGINLNFWPAGPILRRGGAFFLRRTFKGNKLYSSVFNEYLYRLFNQGVPVEYFQEGGRSRTGRLLTPKTGMLAMTLQSVLRGVRKPIVFVPVYIGYERMFEGKSYVGELRGQAKKQESFGQLLGVRKALKRFYGKVYLNFGEPLPLNEFLGQRDINLNAEIDTVAQTSNLRPEWLNSTVSALGDEINRRINAAVSVNSVCLVSLALQATPRQAMDKGELIAQLDTLLALANDAPYSDVININEQTGAELLETAQKLGVVQEFSDPAGDVVFIEGDEAVLSTYFSNNILHIFALSSLISAVFQRNEDANFAQIEQTVNAIYPFLYDELYIHWKPEELAPRLQQLLATMVNLGLLDKNGEQYVRPASDSAEWSRLMLLAQAIQPALQRYAISLTLLNSLQDGQSLQRAELEKESQKLAQRIAALHGINAPEFFDKNLFKNQVKQLREQGLMSVRQEGEGFTPTEQCADFYHAILKLLSIPVQQALQQALRSLQVAKKENLESENP